MALLPLPLANNIPHLREEVQLIDVREPDELLRAEIKGFLNLPLSQFAEWRPKILSGELLDKNKKTVVLCHHGGRSMQFASFLTSQAGFTEVYNLSGGIHMYAQLVDSRIPTGRSGFDFCSGALDTFGDMSRTNFQRVSQVFKTKPTLNRI
ncbi:peptidyl-prolyl cis-trans isomerase c [Nannochloropsis gaditana]|uniref:Peptidyl-prolyl cis-trans isomerase c n=1 Tax=Nannochloropsis gaditana TaxID=72520 RepID=W7TMS8_9STRA|nr:peptidyl-prolyl cis-trans isomerase c [Nannochloropsis gaditana]